MIQMLDAASKIHILLAEDNKLNLEIFRRLIVSCNFKCSCVVDGQEAVDEWKNNPGKFDLILMDLQMPVKTGIEATKEIRKIEKENLVRNPIPIVALTATTFPDELQKALNAGMNVCLTKPIDKLALQESLSRLLK
jgi:CheY-like chemotaxis protein